MTIAVVRAAIALLCALLLSDGRARALPGDERASSPISDVSSAVVADPPSASAEPSPPSTANDVTGSDAANGIKKEAADESASIGNIAAAEPSADPATNAEDPKVDDQKSVASSANDDAVLVTKIDVQTNKTKDVDSTNSDEPNASSTVVSKDEVTADSRAVEVTSIAADEKSLKGAAKDVPGDVAAVSDSVTAMAKDEDSTTSPKEVDGASRRKAGNVADVTVASISGRSSALPDASTLNPSVLQGSDHPAERDLLEDPDLQSRRSFNQMARKIISTVAHSTGGHQPHREHFSTQVPRYIFQTIEVPFHYVIPTYTPFYNPIYNYHPHSSAPNYFSSRYGPHLGPNLFEPHPSNSRHFAVGYPSQGSFQGFDLLRPHGYPNVFPTFPPKIDNNHFAPNRQFYDTRPLDIGAAHYKPRQDASKFFASVRLGGERISRSGGSIIAVSDRSRSAEPVRRGIDDSLVERIFQRREK